MPEIRNDLRHKVRPYAERTTSELLYLVLVLPQQDLPIPTDLTAALDARGINTN